MEAIDSHMRLFSGEGPDFAPILQIRPEDITFQDNVMIPIKVLDFVSLNLRYDASDRGFLGLFPPSTLFQYSRENNVLPLMHRVPEDKEGVVAISYALAQAVKLSQYEVYVEKTMEELESIPYALARHGKIPVGRRQALKKTGKILMVRSKINLHSDLLDTPDYFWDRPKSEKIYLDALKEMDLNQRLGNLNKRLDIMQNIYGLLISQIEHSHTFWLEVVIILLIGVEVIFGVLNLWHINGMHG